MDVTEIGWKSVASSIWLMIGPCKYGNEPSGSIKVGEFLEYLTDICFSRRTLLQGDSYLVIHFLS